MHYVNMSEDELAEIEHFLATGKRRDGVQVTDKWVEDALRRTTECVRELSDRDDLSFQLCQGTIGVVQVARKVYRAWKRKKPIDDLMAELKTVLSRE